MTNLNANFFGNFIDPSPSPDGAVDKVAQGDDNLRALATSMKRTFPNVTSAVTQTATKLNDAAIKGEDETIDGNWEFDKTVIFNDLIQSFKTSTALSLTASGDQFINKTGTGDFYIRSSGVGQVSRITPGGVDVITATPSSINISAALSLQGVVQPTSVACATFTIPAATGQTCPKTNDSGGASLWSAVWTNSNQVTLTHGTGTTAYVFNATISDNLVASYLNTNKLANTIVIQSGSFNYLTGRLIDVTITLP